MMNEKAKKYVDLFRKVKIAFAATVGRPDVGSNHRPDEGRLFSNQKPRVGSYVFLSYAENTKGEKTNVME